MQAKHTEKVGIFGDHFFLKENTEKFSTIGYFGSIYMCMIHDEETIGSQLPHSQVTYVIKP